MTRANRLQSDVQFNRQELDILREHLGHVESSQDLPVSLTSLLTGTDFKRYSFWWLDHRPISPSHVLLTNHEPEWMQNYFANDFALTDPTHMVPRQTMDSVVWSEIPIRDPAQRKLIAASANAGIGNGISIPLHGPFGGTFIAKFTTPAEHIRREYQPLLWLLTSLVMRALLKVRIPDIHHDEATGTPLTCRELECIRWTAAGYTTKDICRHIGISEHTVHFHLTSAMRKLGTNNRTAAAVRAMQMGLLQN